MSIVVVSGLVTSGNDPVSTALAADMREEIKAVPELEVDPDTVAIICDPSDVKMDVVITTRGLDRPDKPSAFEALAVKFEKLVRRYTRDYGCEVTVRPLA